MMVTSTRPLVVAAVLTTLAPRVGSSNSSCRAGCDPTWPAPERTFRSQLIVAPEISVVSSAKPSRASAWPAACDIVDPDETELPRRVYVPPLPLGPAAAAYSRNYELAEDAEIVVLYPQTERYILDGQQRFERSCKVCGVECIPLPPATVLGSQFTRALLSGFNQTRSENLFVIWIADAERALILSSHQDLLRGVQKLLSPPVVDENATVPDVVAAGTRRCREMCGGSFKWPEDDDRISYGTQYLEARLLVGRIGAMLKLSTHIPLPSRPVKDVNLEIGDAVNLIMMHAPQKNETNGTIPKQIVTVGVDRQSHVFQSLHGYDTDLIDDQFGMAFEFRGANDTRFWNKLNRKSPMIAYAGTNVDLLNQVGNYVPLVWSPEINETVKVRAEARSCGEGLAPSLLILVQVEIASPFLEYFLSALEEQKYPKDTTTIKFSLLEATPPRHRLQQKRTLKAWTSRVSGLYRSVSTSVTNASSPVLSAAASTAAGRGHDRVLLMSSHAVLNNSDTLGYLVRGNRTAFTPLITRPGKWFSNIWGAVDGDQFSQCYDADPKCAQFVAKKYCAEGEYVQWMKLNCRYSCALCKEPSVDPAKLEYKRSDDYFHLANRSRRGLFNVPLANQLLMLNRAGMRSVHEGVVEDLNNTLLNQTEVDRMWPWMVNVKVSQWVRRAGGSVIASTLIDAGFLIDDSDFSYSAKHPELNMLDGNEPLWKKQYLAHDYQPEIPGNASIRPECWDIFGFPLVNERFAQHLIDNAEEYGQWSSSRYRDSRLKGGYEPVPTQDIHFNQFGFDKTWKEILRRYIAPIAEHTFPGYNFKGMATLDFIVRYTQDHQASLRPHFDASTVTAVVGLNQYGKDFEGGGTHFIRQKCIVRAEKVGTAVMFPGILTHQHEGLETTKGTRYIIVSFIDQR